MNNIKYGGGFGIAILVSFITICTGITLWYFTYRKKDCSKINCGDYDNNSKQDCGILGCYKSDCCVKNPN